jgi:acyl-CoA thioester hydrolase
MKNFLEGYPVVIEIPISWGEMDAFQHLNNVVYFKYFENARIAYFDKLGLMDMMAGTGIGPILAATSCRFKIPLTYPDKVLVGAKVTHIGEDRITMGHCIFSTTHQKIAAQGDALVVTFNYQENKKAPVPDVLRKRIMDIQGTV